MKRSGKRRPSAALVIACVALFVALGGTVMAATKIDGKTIRVKSLPGDRLEVGSLPGNRLQAGTIPGNRLAPGSVNGTRIDLGTLGEVPSAGHARSADEARHAQTAVAAEHATDATTVAGHAVGCPAGTREFAGSCWDLSPSTTSVTATEAAAACAAAGGELPNALTFVTFGSVPGVAIDLNGEWSEEVSVGAPGQVSDAVVLPSGSIEGIPWTAMRKFRCVTPLLG